MLKKLGITALLLLLGTACTPEQIATWEQLSGQNIPADLESQIIAAPDQAYSTQWGIIEVDGRVTSYAAPAGSRCPQFYDEAIRAGWSPSQWKRIDYIIFRESRCTPSVYNGKGRDNSYGLMQLNMKALKSWVGPMVDWDFTRLYDPYTNLRIGRVLYGKAASMWGCGWKPWSFRCR